MLELVGPSTGLGALLFVSLMAMPKIRAAVENWHDPPRLASFIVSHYLTLAVIAAVLGIAGIVAIELNTRPAVRMVISVIVSVALYSLIACGFIVYMSLVASL